MTRALVLTGQDIAAWRRQFDVGAAPAALPYGVDALETAGFQLSVPGARGGRISTKLRDVVEHRLGYAVRGALQSVPTAFSADVVVALLEREGVLPSLLTQRHVPPYSRTPLVIWSCWLAEEIARADADQRAALRRRYAGADLVTYFNPHATELFVECGFPESVLFPLRWGVSVDYYVPGDGLRDIPVLAVGQDRGRDYGTLFDAVRGSELTVDLVCRPENLEGLDVPSNVRLLGTVPHAEYRQLLRRAQVVAVPTQVLAYPTGSSVVLEAASSGCCIVATDTPAMTEYVRHGETGYLVPPADPDAWLETLRKLVATPEQIAEIGAAARLEVVRRFDARQMWRDLAAEIRRRGLV